MKVSNILGTPKVHRVPLGFWFPWNLPLLAQDLVEGRSEGQSPKSMNNEMFPNYQTLPTHCIHACHVCTHGGGRLGRECTYRETPMTNVVYHQTPVSWSSSPQTLKDKVSKYPNMLSKGLTGMATLDTLLEQTPAKPHACNAQY